MSEVKPFLLELGVEEIPHWMIVPALGDMERLFLDLCQSHQLVPGDLKFDGTPRRLVLRAAGLPERQADRVELVMGPPKSAGPGAAMGFAKKNGVTVEELSTEVTPKGEYFALSRKIEGREVRQILAEALPALISKIPWPKAMYWTGKGGTTFIRPIRWIVAMLGDSVVEFELAGVQSGTLSRGHRRMGADEIAFDHTNYEERLEKNGVILSAAKRRKRIQDGIKKLLKGKGLELIADDSLLDDLVYLTEYPTPILGSFNPEFLALPQEVLSTVMRHHQRYFTMRDGEGKMAPHFLAIMNMKADKKGYVVKGNERVLEARFNDARFFWDQDQSKKLADRVEDLANVTFQAKLGSYKDKRLGVEAGVCRIAAALNLDSRLARRAAELCKTDLMTEMVKELTELQGVMGGLYAKAQGEPGEVWKAIYEHYEPASMESEVPSSDYGKILSIADKLDSLEGCFALGMIPSGSKDPLGLRRAAQGIVKTIVEGRLRLNLKKIVNEGAEETNRTFLRIRSDYKEDRAADGELKLAKQIWEFLLDRVRYYFREVRHYAYDELSAVLAAGPVDLVDIESRLYALKLVRQTEEFEPLAAAFKRMRNILKQAGWQGGTVNPALLEEGAERELFDETSRVLAKVAVYRRSEDYMASLNVISTLKPAVDHFFDKILVNAPDPAVRDNRLALLGGLYNEVSSIADFSEIVTSSTTE
ncbi:glycine--tRNA ligase subunit beta [Paludibaculum fermentans]|uniref:glycine--tRNA ligase subunit beta n=1 Tax=Paludibaculum fermentans TaxID=1473598 RepID=UPI003EBA20DE